MNYNVSKKGMEENGGLFAVFNCTTEGGEKRYLYRGGFVAVQRDQVDAHWSANGLEILLVKTHSSGDVHASEWAAMENRCKPLPRLHPDPPLLKWSLLSKMNRWAPFRYLSRSEKNTLWFLRAMVVC